jgi:hypothetical protein
VVKHLANCKWREEESNRRNVCGLFEQVQYAGTGNTLYFIVIDKDMGKVLTCSANRAKF